MSNRHFIMALSWTDRLSSSVAPDRTDTMASNMSAFNSRRSALTDPVWDCADRSCPYVTASYSSSAGAMSVILLPYMQVPASDETTYSVCGSHDMPYSPPPAPSTRSW